MKWQGTDDAPGGERCNPSPVWGKEQFLLSVQVVPGWLGLRVSDDLAVFQAGVQPRASPGVGRQANPRILRGDAIYSTESSARHFLQSGLKKSTRY